MIRIAIVDDHALVREGIKRIFNNTDIMVIAEFSNTKGFLKDIENLELDIVLLDLSMPDGNGLDIIREVKKRNPKLTILILSMHPEERYAMRSFSLGADGYLTKDSDPELIIAAIKKVTSGRKCFSTLVIDQMLSLISGENKTLPHEKLSNREFEVLRSLGSGQSVKEIGASLYLSTSTVNTYRSRIKEKLSLQKNTDIIYYAITNKLID